MQFADYVRMAGRPMVAPLAGFPGITLTNSTIAENLRDARLQTRTITALHSLVDFDIVFPMMDLTVESEALGAEVDWETDEMPTVHKPIVATLEDVEALRVPVVGHGNRLGVFVETCASLRNAFPDKLVWAYALGPYSIAGRLMGMTDISIAVKLEPQIVHALLRKCNELLSRYATALLSTGVDGLMILEPAASLLRADDAVEFSCNYVGEIVDLVKRHAKTPALHNCGDIGHMVEPLCATGIEALSVGSVTDPRSIYGRLPRNVVVMGNLDPTEVFLRGTPWQVREAAVTLATSMADCTRFVLSSGCDLPPGVPLDNLKALECPAGPCLTPGWLQAAG